MLAQLAKDKGVQSMVGDAIAESSDNSFFAKMARNPKGVYTDQSYSGHLLFIPSS
jgi:hypothetical protein